MELNNKVNKEQVIEPKKCKECDCEFEYLKTEENKILVKYRSGNLTGKFELINMEVVECPICGELWNIKKLQKFEVKDEQ